jgi:starch synthase (maltosyl-transferring)
MFKSRVALAATLSSTYVIYNGFELLEHDAVPGKEEYLDSEKYELKSRDWNKPSNIKGYIAQLNRARSANPALQQTSELHFLNIEDGNIIGFVKRSLDQTNVVVAVIALSSNDHSFWLPLNDVTVMHNGELRPVVAIQNLVTEEVHALEWGGVHVSIDPQQDPAAMFGCLV